MAFVAQIALKRYRDLPIFDLLIWSCLFLYLDLSLPLSYMGKRLALKPPLTLANLSS